MRKFLPALALALGAVPVLAQETTPTMDTTPVSTAASALRTGLVEILNNISPLVIAVVVAGVGIWAIPRIVGIIKSGFQSGKGR